MPKPLPIGVSDYKLLIEKDYYYVDKTLFIKELLQVGGAAAVICRPRRFGKTLNLSMLQYFFEKTDENNAHLFQDKAIWHDEKCRTLQGQYPVIFLTFKDIKEKTWEEAKTKCIALIAQEFARHRSFIKKNSTLIDEIEFETFNNLAIKNGTPTDISQSLYLLCKILHTITKKRVFLLLDEYDAPIHAAYNNGYYSEMIAFMQGILSTGLKDNKYLEHAVLTGILRTAKEGIFSGLNNLNVCTLLHDSFADKFGFTSQEVDTLLENQGISFESETIKNWYNGYHVGKKTLVYNPWSIIECAKNDGELRLYWLNTSGNILIKNLIAHAHEETKKDLEQLLIGIPFTKIINEAFAFSDIQNNQDVLWDLLLFSGYITYSQRTLVHGQYECTLIIPNEEIKVIYRNLLQSIFQQSFKTTTITHLLTSLQANDVERFSYILQEFIINSMSYFDFSSDEPEKSYHLFVLGMLVLLNDAYHIRSNRESGYGRYDLMLIPKDKTKYGIIMEFKKASSDDAKILETACDQALQQIKQNKYVQELKTQTIEHGMLYAIAFYGKKVFVKTEFISFQ